MRVSATAYLVWCNLTGYVYVPVKYELFWKVTSIKSAFLNFVLLVGTFWHLREMSEFRIVHDELVLILLVCIKEWTGMVLKENSTVGFWISPGGEGQ